MTRARDELYVCGYTVNQQKPDCWYELVRQGLMTHERVATGDDGTLRVAGTQAATLQSVANGDDAIAPLAALPEWALAPVPPGVSPPPTRAPSRLSAPRSRRPPQGVAWRSTSCSNFCPIFRRGTATGPPGGCWRGEDFRPPKPTRFQRLSLGLIEDPAFAHFLPPRRLLKSHLPRAFPSRGGRFQDRSTA